MATTVGESFGWLAGRRSGRGIVSGATPDQFEDTFGLDLSPAGSLSVWSAPAATCGSSKGNFSRLLSARLPGAGSGGHSAAYPAPDPAEVFAFALLREVEDVGNKMLNWELS